MKVVIVGGVAGGATAAARIRRLKEDAEIVIFEKSSYISYANCGLPYYIGGIIGNKKDLTIQTPSSLKNRFNIDVRIKNEVISIDADNKFVVVKNLETNEVYNESYDKLILSPGARPVVPEIEGIYNDKVLTLRTVDDAFKIKSYLEDKGLKRVTIIGGGFIGIELLENLINLGIDVTLIEGSNQIIRQLDLDMVAFVNIKLWNLGIKIYFNTIVDRIENTENGLNLIVDNNVISQADLVLVTVGIIPETEFIQGTNIKLGIKNSIFVNEKMETSVKDIYAVGDAVEIENFITKEQELISLAGPANKQGRIAANNICGITQKYHGSQNSTILKFFDWTIATTGINEKQAKKLKLNYEKVILSSNSNATYYPSGSSMTIKVLYNKADLKILGAQLIGQMGVDKRIDVLATAIRGGMKATELVDIDLCYAPPYSSAKDPINMVGYIIENIENNLVKQCYFEDLNKLMDNIDNIILLDTRTVSEYTKGHIEGFKNIPLDELRKRLNELAPNKAVYVMCQSGLRSYIACRILMQNGFTCYNFSGGYKLYEALQFNQEIYTDRLL